MIVLRSLELYRVAIPMTEPFRISSGAVAEKEALLVRASDGEFEGWGESSAMPGGFYSTETPDSCERELRSLLPGLEGHQFAGMDKLDRVLAESTPTRFVRVAVETAVWEMMARRRGVSLRGLLDIPHRPIPSGLAIGLYGTPEELCDAITRYRVRDYRRLKIKIKRGQDIELVQRVREMLPDFPLFVDANADYGRADFDVFRELDRFGLMMFEQPLAKDAMEDSAELQRKVGTPICFDESIETVEDARHAIALDACRIVNIKLQRVGGYLEAMRIVDVCRKAGVPVWMGTMPELGVGSAQALMLAAHPAFTFPTDVEPSSRWYRDDIIAPELKLANGCLTWDPGTRVDEAKLEKYGRRLL